MGFCNFSLIRAVRERNFSAGTKQWDGGAVPESHPQCPMCQARVNPMDSIPKKPHSDPLESCIKSSGLHIVGGIYIKEERVSLTFSQCPAWKFQKKN